MNKDTLFNMELTGAPTCQCWWCQNSINKLDGIEDVNERYALLEKAYHELYEHDADRITELGMENGNLYDHLTLLACPSELDLKTHDDCLGRLDNGEQELCNQCWRDALKGDCND